MSTELFLVYSPKANTTRYLLIDAAGDISWGAHMSNAKLGITFSPTNLDELPRELLDKGKFFPRLNSALVPQYVGPMDESVYVKIQPLLADPGLNFNPPRPLRATFHKQMLTREALIAQSLRTIPHRNIAEFRGTIIHPVSGLVTGLAYKKYTMDLHYFAYERKIFDRDQIKTVVEGVRAGMEHLHKNGIVHCDLRPPNIFLTLGSPAEGTNDTNAVIDEVVLGDFDASRNEGEIIDGKLIADDFRHPDFNFQSKAAFELDTYALEKVEEWMGWQIEDAPTEQK